MIQLIDFFRKRPAAGRYLLLGLAFAVFIWSLTIDTAHAHTWAEKYIPGFWSIFGFLSSLVLIYFARWYGRAGIEQEEGFYDN